VFERLDKYRVSGDNHNDAAAKSTRKIRAWINRGQFGKRINAEYLVASALTIYVQPI
jgi:hypothetical protein